MDIRAVRYIMSDDTASEYHMPAMGRLSISQYVDKIKALVGDHVDQVNFEGVKHARITLAYVVAEVINNPDMTASQVWDAVLPKINSFFNRFTWTSKDAYERTSTDGDDVKPQKKSSKEEIMSEFRKYDFETMSRDEIVDAVAKSVTAARSSLVNYYYTHRKQVRTARS